MKKHSVRISTALMLMLLAVAAAYALSWRLSIAMYKKREL